MMLPKLLGGRRKKDRRPTDLKIPVPRLHGIHNADLTDSQIASLLSKPHQPAPSQFNKDYFARTYNHRIVAQGEPFREARDMTGPVLFMPKPGHPLPPARRLLRGEDHDKTQIESEHEPAVEDESCESDGDNQDNDVVVASLDVKPSDGGQQNNNLPANPSSFIPTAVVAASNHVAPLKPKATQQVSSKPNLELPAVELDSIDFRTTPNIPGHYPKSASIDKSATLERASYMSEMSSNESQQTFETAPQSPFSRLSSVCSTPSMSILADIDIPDSLDPSNVLYDMSLQRHSAPEAYRGDISHPNSTSQSLESLKPVMLVNQHHQIESFPALLSPEVQSSQSPQSPQSSKGKSAGITSSNMTSPASSITTTKAASSAITTPGQGSVKRYNSINSQRASNPPTVKVDEVPVQSSSKPAESSNESNATATPNSRLAETTAEIEALRQQMVAIQNERTEWKKRENEHRAREREMLEQISRTQEQLQFALAQAGFFTGSKTSKNPTPISQSSSGIVNADLDTTSSGSWRGSRKKSSVSRNHSHSRGHYSRSRSTSRGRTMPHADRYQHEPDRRRNHRPHREHSRSRSYERSGGRRYDHRGYMLSSSSDSHDDYDDWRSQPRRRSSRDSYSRRSHRGDYSSDSDYEHRGRRRRYARSLDPPSRTISRSRSGSVSRTPHAYHSAVEDEEQARTRSGSDHRNDPHRHHSRTRHDSHRSRSDPHLHSQQRRPQPKGDVNVAPQQPTPSKPPVANGKVEPSPIVTPKSILRNGGILSRQSSAGSAVRKTSNGRTGKENV